MRGEQKNWLSVSRSDGIALVGRVGLDVRGSPDGIAAGTADDHGVDLRLAGGGIDEDIVRDRVVTRPPSTRAGVPEPLPIVPTEPGPTWIVSLPGPRLTIRLWTSLPWIVPE
jgi:hypothetical protein